MTDTLELSRDTYSPTLGSIFPSFEDPIDTDLTARDYYSSSFPSLMPELGPYAQRRNNIKPPKRHVSFVKQTITIKDKFSEEGAKNTKQRKSEEKLSFAEEMRKRNENQWLRIQAVAQEKLDRYEKYAMGMLVKVRRQREQINRRSQQLLDSLAREEEKKREHRFYDSSHGRMWRHHRTMQRRAFSLEPIRKENNQIFKVTTPDLKVST